MYRKVDFSFFRGNHSNNSVANGIIWIALTALVCGQTPEGNLILTDGLNKQVLVIDNEMYLDKSGKRQLSRLGVGETYNFINLSYMVASGELQVYT